MFNSLGFGEIVTIVIVALIVFGPHRLPDMAHKLGTYFRDFRAAAAEIRKGLEAEVAELRDPIDSLKKDLTKPVSDLKGTWDEMADKVKGSAGPVGESVTDAVERLKGAGQVQWVGAEPATGVSPSESWEGMKDDVPEEILATSDMDASSDIDAPSETEAESGAEEGESPDRPSE
jgi:Tat protein translocase TatB subunit